MQEKSCQGEEEEGHLDCVLSRQSIADNILVCILARASLVP